MSKLQKSYPSIYEILKNRELTASISGLPIFKIPCNQIFETNINHVKIQNKTTFRENRN